VSINCFVVKVRPFSYIYICFSPDSGAQPLVNESGNVILCVNGEIYNHKSLRRHLKKEHVFKTHSDCEIILYLYEEMGPDFVGLLDGMFSFVLYDKEKDIYVSCAALFIATFYNRHLN
jgi:asparagine synthase (glutamine-hydrolysing)